MSNGSGGLAPWQVERVTLHLRANLAQPLGPVDLATMVNLSPSHFCRAFKRSFGCTVHRYIMHKRVELARELILHTSEELSQVALLCGMADQSHLTRWFRRVMGQAPGRWRRAQSFAQA